MIVQGREAIRLVRLPFTERRFNEGWLQTLLFQHPALIPVEDIEPAFGPLRPVTRELVTGVGAVDLVYVNPEGFLTLVETKLWRNPEARREVVAQVIDYAKAMAGWSYETLVEAVRGRAAKSVRRDPLLAAVADGDEEAEEDFDDRRFIDAVGRNLRAGRFLLLVVGDGIQEGVEAMAEFLARTPQLAFTLALVEVAVFHPVGREEPLFVQPRVVARTREVVRAIVEIRTAVSPGDVAVSLPSESAVARASTITEQEYEGRLRKAAGPEAVAFVQSLLPLAEPHRLDVRWSSRGPALRYIHEDTGHVFKFVRFLYDGTLSLGDLERTCISAGIPRDVAWDFVRQTTTLMPGATTRGGTEKDTLQLVGPSGKGMPFVALTQVRDQWLTVVDRTVEQIDMTLEGRSRA
jgi:hypothetical protein